MWRVVGGVLAMLPALPALAAEDKPKEKPPGPSAQYQTLVKEFGQAQQAFFKAYSEASDEGKQKLLKEKYPNFGPRFLALAQEHPQDPAALDALVWIATNSFNRTASKDSSLSKALDILLRDHLQSDKLASVCQGLSFSGNEEEANAFLLALLKKSPSKAVQAEACLALAQRALQRVELVQQLKKDADTLKQLVQVFGKEYVDQLQKEDISKLEAASEEFFRQFTDKHVSALTAKRLTSLCSRMGFSTDKGSEAVLRALIAKDARAEVQGPACLFLAKVLWRRAEALPDPTGQEAARLLKESETLLERAAAQYADVKLDFYGAIGKKAKSELYSLRNLAVGKVAPEIEAQDQDGKKFRLSDYRGKVVLLDFWSEF